MYKPAKKLLYRLIFMNGYAYIICKDEMQLEVGVAVELTENSRDGSRSGDEMKRKNRTNKNVL